MGGSRSRAALGGTLVCLLSLLLGTGIARAAFPQDPPDDPNYDPAEEGGMGTCSTATGYNQQTYLFSAEPQCTPGATDADGSAGMNLGTTASDPDDAGEDSAWADFTIGNDETLIAYVEAGINWRNGDVEELRNRVYLNPDELPAPTTNVADGVLNADDFADTSDSNGNGAVDPEDIIARFSDGTDDDGNGYIDDISGWDFYDNQNDPATVDSEYGHANGQMKQAAAETNNGIGDAGVCPKCRLLPIKGGAEALDRTDDLAEAWLFAGDSGADVIVSVTADLGYSSFMAQAVDKLWRDGVVMVEASNDFNSTDHQGGHFHPHVLPGNGLVANTQGIPGNGTPFATVGNGLTNTYSARASYPEWGTHNMFPAATTGGTTSESTPTVGGVMAIVLAYGEEAADATLIDGPLSGQEAIQVVRDTADDIDGNPSDPLPGWEGKPGFDLQYGYGRPDVLAAMQKIKADEIPPVAWIDSPEWYALVDPTQQSSVPISGHVEAERSASYDWELQYAPGFGGEPADGDFTTLATGSGTAPQEISSSLDLSAIPSSFWQKAMELSTTKALETNEHYTVTLRLQVTDAGGRLGEERRSIAVQRDPNAQPGFPKKIGPGGESQPVMADLQGTGRLALVFGDSDGVVHAIGPNGSELPGWPVTTNATQVTKSHAGIDPGHEPIIPGVAVGDIDHDGLQDVVATTTTGAVYVWNANGVRRGGWPKSLDAGVVKPPVPRPDLPFTRTAIKGATAPPVLADLDGNGTLEVVQGGWDGYLHAWRPNGSELPGYPVDVKLPDGYSSSLTVIQDQKVTVPPAIAELDGDPLPEVIVRSQFNEAGGGGLRVAGVQPMGEPPPLSHLHAYNEDGSVVGGWDPATIEALVFYYGSAQEFITEGANAPITADINGDALSETVAAAGIFSPSYKVNPDGSVATPMGPTPNLDAYNSLLNDPPDAMTITGLIGDYAGGSPPEDTPVNFTTSGAFGRTSPLETLSFAEPGSGAQSVAGSLLLAGSGIPINNYLRVNDATTGGSLAGFPAKTQGLDFLGAPVIADVTGDDVPEIIEGGDSSALHAFMTDPPDKGLQAPDFPKFMTGWMLFGPSVGDLDSDGTVEVAAMTREGYLMVWDTPGTAAGNDEWWSYRHDERNTANYDSDTRPPGIIRGGTITPAAAGTFNFTAPGDDWYSGTVDHYEAATSDDPITPANFGSATQLGGEPIPTAAGTAQAFILPNTIRRYVAIRAVDEAGNLGPILVRDRGPGAGGGGGGTGGACSHTINGTGRNDRLVGTSGGDRIFALPGNDRVAALAGDDCVRGSGGNDRIQGGKGRDTLRGGKGRDRLKGGPGRDVMRGGFGRDVLKARDGGGDIVDCGPGRRDKALVDRGDRVKRCERVRRKRH